MATRARPSGALWALIAAVVLVLAPVSCTGDAAPDDVAVAVVTPPATAVAAPTPTALAIPTSAPAVPASALPTPTPSPSPTTVPTPTPLPSAADDAFWRNRTYPTSCLPIERSTLPAAGDSRVLTVGATELVNGRATTRFDDGWSVLEVTDVMDFGEHLVAVSLRCITSAEEPTLDWEVLVVEHRRTGLIDHLLAYHRIDIDHDAATGRVEVAAWAHRRDDGTVRRITFDIVPGLTNPRSTVHDIDDFVYAAGAAREADPVLGADRLAGAPFGTPIDQAMPLLVERFGSPIVTEPASCKYNVDEISVWPELIVSWQNGRLAGWAYSFDAFGLRPEGLFGPRPDPVGELEDPGLWLSTPDGLAPLMTVADALDRSAMVATRWDPWDEMAWAGQHRLERPADDLVVIVDDPGPTGRVVGMSSGPFGCLWWDPPPP